MRARDLGTLHSPGRARDGKADDSRLTVARAEELRCNRASEAFARAALGMHSQPLFLLVDDNARRTASLSRAFEASGAHAIVPSRLLPLRGALAPWNETAAQMKAQECPRECRVGSWHPGPRHHRTVAWAIAQLHLSEVANALWRCLPPSFPFRGLLHLPSLLPLTAASRLSPTASFVAPAKVARGAELG